MGRVLEMSESETLFPETRDVCVKRGLDAVNRIRGT